MLTNCLVYEGIKRLAVVRRDASPLFFNGTWDGTRTHTLVRAADFLPTFIFMNHIAVL